MRTLNGKIPCHKDKQSGGIAEEKTCQGKGREKLPRSREITSDPVWGGSAEKVEKKTPGGRNLGITFWGPESKLGQRLTMPGITTISITKEETIRKLRSRVRVGGVLLERNQQFKTHDRENLLKKKSKKARQKRKGAR